MKKLILLLVMMIYGLNSHALEGKTFVFFINGDWYYKGPVFEEDKIRLKDQAKIIYEDMVEKAKKDHKNNYVLFYDPKGKGRLFNRRWVKLRIYRKGDKVYSFGLRKPEVDTGDPMLYQELRSLMDEHLGAVSQQDKMLYFYGEHFPAHGTIPLDLNGGGEMGLDTFMTLAETLGPFHTMVLHTCYLNSLDVLGPLFARTLNTAQVLVPHKAILNTHLKWDSSLKEPDFFHFAKSFQIENRYSDKYYFHLYGKEVEPLYHAVKKLESFLAIDYWREQIQGETLDDFSWLDQRTPESFVLPIGDRVEPFLPIYSFVTLMDQYLLREEGQLDAIDHLIDESPHLLKMYKILPSM